MLHKGPNWAMSTSSPLFRSVASRVQGMSPADRRGINGLQRARLRTLAGTDELVAAVVRQLDELGILDDT